MSNTSTPYDDAQRTLSVDCPSLLIPLVNEAFQTDYPLDAGVQDYSLEEIFEKRLLFLLPYYFLRYQLELLERDADARQALRNTYRDIFQRLSLLEKGGEITEFTRQSIKAMIDKVAMFRASRYASVKKEVEEIMGGQILNYEAKDIRNMALREGMQEGIAQNILAMYRKGKTPEEIAELIDKDLEEVRSVIEKNVLNTL